MDQELLQYLDERFNGLVHGLDQRFEQIDRRFEGIDRRFEQIDRRFDEVTGRLDEVTGHVSELTGRIDEVTGRVGELTGRVDEVTGRVGELTSRFDGVNDRIDEVKRHNGVLIEDLRYQVRLVAEGFATFVDGRYTQDQAKIDRRFDETNALIRSSYNHLHQRVENLERNRPN